MTNQERGSWSWFGSGDNSIVHNHGSNHVSNHVSHCDGHDVHALQLQLQLQLQPQSPHSHSHKYSCGFSHKP